VSSILTWAEPVSEALHMLLRETPMLPDDNIQVVGWDGFRAFLIRDALQQLGEPHHGRLKRLPPILPRLLLKRSASQWTCRTVGRRFETSYMARAPTSRFTYRS